MTDYYSELKLDKNLGVGELNSALNKLESTWRQREIRNPEKSMEMLVLIMQARKVFASEDLRKSYDAELKNNKTGDERQKQDDSNNEDELRKWVETSRNYYSAGQYDLAKTAIENAFAIMSPDKDDDKIFSLAADIFRENGDFNSALNYINKAIVENPEIPDYYLSKGLIYDGQAAYASQHFGFGNPSAFYNEARKMYLQAEQYAGNRSDSMCQARACGALAFSYYYQSPIDKEKGEKYANLALQYGGDSWGNADKVLLDIRRINEENEKRHNEEERRKKEEERKIKEEQEETIRAEQARKEEVARRKAIKERTLVISLCLLLIAMVIPLISLY